MKHLLPLFLILLCSCEATRGANAALEAEAQQLELARLELMRTQIMGESQEAIDAARAVFESEVEDVKAAGAAQVEAARQDFQNALGAATKTGALAAGVPVPWAEILGTAAAAAGATWIARDRRKRLGKDPLQLAALHTPSVSSAVELKP